MKETALVTAKQTQNWEDREMLEVVKQTVCKGATDAQFKMFVEVCRATGLSPWLKEIWYVPSVGVMAARDGYLRVANEHPAFDGMKTVVERDQKGIPIKATCSVYRKDRSHPVECEAYFNEYKKGGNVWSTYPSAMIGKVAEVLALKRSFSINGVVSEEEVGFDEPKEKTRKEKVEDAQAVAKRKIEEMKAIAAPAPTEVIIERQIEDPPPPPEQTYSVDFKKTLGYFSDIKKEFAKEGKGDKYYAVLGVHGFEHANQIRPMSQAKPIYKEMAQALIDIRSAKALEL